MPLVTLVVPGSLATHTGGYIYDQRIVDGLRARGWTVNVCELDDSFPHPTPAALATAGQVLGAIPDGSIALVDGLALGAMPDQAEHERSRLRIAALVHLPLAADAGLTPDTAARLHASEQRALACASVVVVTGACTRTALADYGVDPRLIILVHPGTDRAPLSSGSSGSQVELLTVGTLTRRKGHDVLFRALGMLPNTGWHLTCVGSLEREPRTVEALRARLATEGLERLVTLAGDIDDKCLEECYRQADVFVLATLHETYGMAVAEALAHGLPVVSTTDRAISELVGDDAGVLVPPGEVAPLSDALGHVITDAAFRTHLATGARRIREQLPTWDDAADGMAAALQRVLADG